MHGVEGRIRNSCHSGGDDAGAAGVLVLTVAACGATNAVTVEAAAMVHTANSREEDKDGLLLEVVACEEALEDAIFLVVWMLDVMVDNTSVGS